MMIKASWNSGNFTLAHTAEVDDVGLAALAEKGLLWHAQRNGEHDKALGSMETVDGREKRKTGWKRGDVGYSASGASALVTAYAELGDLEAVETVVTEYVREEGAKFVDEKAGMLKHESAGDLEAWLKTSCGYSGATHGEDGEYSVDALRAVRVRRLALQAEMLKGL